MNERSPVPPALWLSAEGPCAAVVVATRCRLARNLSGRRFPSRASDTERRGVLDAVSQAAHRAGGDLGRALILRSDDVRAGLLERLVEWRYASLDWARGGTHRGLLIMPDGSGSLLVNEEDHLRLQVVLPGLQVECALGEASTTEADLAERLSFAYRQDIGYLTASPVNAGTGMRLSVLVHLPGLGALGALQDALQAAEDLGCSVRGLYGEGTRGTGFFFQVSNTRTLGVTESRVSGEVSAATVYLIGLEERARSEAYGTGARREDLVQATQEAIHRLFQEEVPPEDLLGLVSALRLAVAEGVLSARLRQAAEWVALAGTAAAVPQPVEATTRQYEAIRRSSALRQRLRSLVGSPGTLGTGRTE